MSTALPLPASSCVRTDRDRVSLSKESLKRAFLDNLYYIQGKFPALATR